MWAFRVASRPEVGGGHVARCLTLARALGHLNQHVVFILDDGGRRWERMIAEAGHACILASDACPPDVAACLFDGYDFDERTVAPWRGQVRVMAAMVDHQPIPAWADLAIAASARPADIGPIKTEVLAGLDFALVDPAFVAHQPRAVRNKAENVLVSFGQRDSKNATGLALEALELLDREREIAVTVALGRSALHLSAVTDRVAGMSRVALEVDADMKRCYSTADLVVGGGGVGLLERMAQGLPSVSVTLADNQRCQIELCAQSGGTVDAGGVDDLDAARLVEILSPLFQSRERRAAMGAAARHAVDGAGAVRCAKAMSEILRLRADPTSKRG